MKNVLFQKFSNPFKSQRSPSPQPYTPQKNSKTPTAAKTNGSPHYKASPLSKTLIKLSSRTPKATAAYSSRCRGDR